jgi:hypothetical protein
MSALLHAENIDRRASDTLKRAQSIMMAGMDYAPAGSADWGHGVGDWNEWLKEWEAYKKTAAYQKAHAEVRFPPAEPCRTAIRHRRSMLDMPGAGGRAGTIRRADGLGI